MNAAPFFSINIEISVALFFLLSILLYLIYFEVNKENSSTKLSEKFRINAFKIYTVSVLLMLIGLAALSKFITLSLSDFFYFIIGFLGIQFVFFWKLKLEVTGSLSYPNSIDDRLVVNLDKDELVLLSLLVEGKTDKEISELLYRSQPAIKKQLSSLYKKIRVKNRTEAAVYYNRATKRDM